MVWSTIIIIIIIITIIVSLFVDGIVKYWQNTMKIAFN